MAKIILLAIGLLVMLAFFCQASQVVDRGTGIIILAIVLGGGFFGGMVVFGGRG